MTPDEGVMPANFPMANAVRINAVRLIHQTNGAAKIARQEIFDNAATKSKSRRLDDGRAAGFSPTQVEAGRSAVKDRPRDFDLPRRRRERAIFCRVCRKLIDRECKRHRLLRRQPQRRHAATRALLERDDVIIVASVSCIYGIGSVETYSAMTFTLKQGTRIDQRQLIADLVALQYKRVQHDFSRGTSRVRGDCIDLFPAHYEDRAWRISLFRRRDRQDRGVRPLTGGKTDELEFIKVYANSRCHATGPAPMQRG